MILRGTEKGFTGILQRNNHKKKTDLFTLIAQFQCAAEPDEKHHNGEQGCSEAGKKPYKHPEKLKSEAEKERLKQENASLSWTEKLSECLKEEEERSFIVPDIHIKFFPVNHSKANSQKHVVIPCYIGNLKKGRCIKGKIKQKYK